MMTARIYWLPGWWLIVLLKPLIAIEFGRAEIDRFDHSKWNIPVTGRITGWSVAVAYRGGVVVVSEQGE